MIDKVSRAVKKKSLVNSARNYIGRKIVTAKVRCISGMNYLPSEKVIKINSSDYIRTATLELMAYEINGNRVEGNVAELGVYRGDFARCINSVFPDRKLFLFDTFEGFDNRDIALDVGAGYSTGRQDFTDTNVGLVLKKMPRRDNVVIKKGWFPDTTRGLENEKFVFVSIDADLYEPIYQGLKFFYPRLQSGGSIFVHDFNNKGYKGSSEAVRKFCREENIGYLCLPDECGSAVLIK